MGKRPLEGLRVADFSWFGAGPIAANTLASFGAEVVRVESAAKIDGLRRVHPFAMNSDGSFKTGLNVSGYFNNFNAGKLSLHPQPEHRTRPGDRLPAGGEVGRVPDQLHAARDRQMEPEL